MIYKWYILFFLSFIFYEYSIIVYHIILSVFSKIELLIYLKLDEAELRDNYFCTFILLEKSPFIFINLLIYYMNNILLKNHIILYYISYINYINFN